MQSLQGQLIRKSLPKCAVINYQARYVAQSSNAGAGGFVRKVVRDRGNWPMIFANATAVSLIVIFSLRKIMYHPDITIAEDNRFSPEVQNETASRSEDAQTFRDQTRFFAQKLYQPAKKILKMYTGAEPTEKFNLDFVRETAIPVPLEQTDYFDDGLYEGIQAKPFAENIINDQDFMGRIKDRAT